MAKQRLTPQEYEPIPICVRAFVPALTDAKQRRKPPNPQQGPSEYTLVIDTETMTDAGQCLRFGIWQLRERDELIGKGAFFNPTGLSRAEQVLLCRYAKKTGMDVLTAAEFVEQIFYGIAYDLRATIVGFNLPFDLSRLAFRHGYARGKAMRGGFTLILSPRKWRPPIQMRHLSARVALKQFTKPWKQHTARGGRKRDSTNKPRRGSFIDLKTAAAALTSQSFSLATLAEFLQTPHRKQSVEAHGTALNEAYLDYACNDVQVTWECYAALRTKFEEHGLRSTLFSQILSEASLGKAYLREMGVASLETVQPDFPNFLKGHIMSGYYGGRSEVHIRRRVSQLLYCDFLSMYPTVCVLMELWRFVIAKGLSWRESTVEVRSFLERIELDGLQRAENWRNLTTMVQVAPDGDHLPIRAKYDREPQAKIGLNCLKSETPLWFTLHDCIASKLRTGKAPKVLRAITFVPGEPQSGLTSFAILGRSEYLIDPRNDDFYKRLIDLRTEVKGRLKGASGQQAIELETAQQFLKILANSTSYGIFVELNVADLDKPEKRLCYGPGEQPFPISTTKVEQPGRYFHPLLATLITGAARLMLAIAETLAARRGLDWVLCDTDSMAFAKPDWMGDEEFYARVQSIRSWFTPLNPYEHKEPLLKLEEFNYALAGSRATDKLEPLFCLAISDKRYALFNIGPDGRPIIRKASAHGLGHLIAPYGEHDAPASIPPPVVSLQTIGVERWHYDLWYQIILAAVEGHPDTVDLSYHPALKRPAASRYAATTPTLLKWFNKYNEGKPQAQQVWPFNFLLAFQVSAHRFRLAHEDDAVRPPKPQKIPVPKPVAPYDSDIGRAAKACFDRETGQAVPSELLMTYGEVLGSYHLHAETKFLNGEPFNQGVTAPRHIEAIAVNCIGKEANKWEEQFYLGHEEDEMIEYGLASQAFGRLKDAMKESKVSQRAVAEVSGISRTTLSKLIRGEHVRDAELLIRKALAAIDQISREKREDIWRRNTRPKDQWLERTGGLRFGESPEQFRQRVAEIKRLETAVISGQVHLDNMERVQRRLCALKGIYFDEYEPPDD
jgi:transcriptional regulator with XRE-family HTH domain